MFYCLIGILFMMFFVLYMNMRKMHTTVIFLCLIAYFVSISSIIVYLSRDTYYYNLLKQYFYLPEFLWRKFFFLNLDKFSIIRIMNLSSLLVAPLSIHFSMTYFTGSPSLPERLLKGFAWANAVLQYVIYDPALNIRCYYLLYPRLLTSGGYNLLIEKIYMITKLINRGLLLFSIVFLLISFRNVPRLRIFRFHFLFLCTGYTCLGIVYLFFISAIPAFYLNISKISDSYTYRTIYLGENIVLYRAFPYFLGFSLLLFIYACYQLTRLNRQVNLEELTLSREISASETTSKIFCHYIKNEVLAIQTDLEMLPNTPETSETLENLKRRCGVLYERIDELHRNTRTGELHLETCDIKKLLENALEPYSCASGKMQATLLLPQAPAFAFADRHYLLQAFDNVIRNAADAMEGAAPEKNRLTVSMSTTKDWILIGITDTGIGISKENMKHIFSPFYSSHPYSRHWGVGLPLTYKIIRAHEGNMEIKSTPHVGTTVQIMLPLLKKGKGAAREPRPLKENRL